MSKSFAYNGHRNSYTDLNKAYFWTITIKGWRPLLKEDDFKQIIISSLQWLCKNKLVIIYGYVIMPNHIHLLWEQLKMNGKEYPKNSFEKFTAHHFRRKLLAENIAELKMYEVIAEDRLHNFWQRDPLAVYVYGRDMALQKLTYMHNNPLQAHWNLSATPEQYRFSSAAFYENGVDEFGILTHFRDIF